MINTNNNLNMVIAEMDAIKDNMLYGKVCDISKKQALMQEQLNRIESKLDIILKMLGETNG